MATEISSAHPVQHEPLQQLRGGLYSAAAGTEEAAIQKLIATENFSREVRRQIKQRAARLVAGARNHASERPLLDAFLQEFGLSNQEGVALLCLAETLLRVPDDDTADRLIAEKLASGDWSVHSGASESLFVNASTWGLMLTGQLVQLDSSVGGDTGGWLQGLTHRLGEPIVRAAMRSAMRVIAGEFIVGRTIEEATARSGRESKLQLCSYDMLGEGARTLADAERYFEAYAHAIETLGADVKSRSRLKSQSVHEVSGISIKLSALEPRYSFLQRERVHARLVPRVVALARLAASHNIGLTMDAEEADRLELSLDVIEALASDGLTRTWEGLGVVVQAYGRRAPALIDWLTELARETRRRLCIRLVKGAYWDTEIKRTQERGLVTYPVYTRKCTTDVAYAVCVKRLFANAAWLYPQFATHNATTLGTILELQPPRVAYEFQRLHGMGELLYAELERQCARPPRVRVYAPVGQHPDLLAYLVRRLLENGANTSFVNRFMDDRVPIEQVVADPFEELERSGHTGNPRLPPPLHLFGNDRLNSEGADLGEGRTVELLSAALAQATNRQSHGGTLVGGQFLAGHPATVLNPADRRVAVGTVTEASGKEISEAFTLAARAQPGWNALGGDERAKILEHAADYFAANRTALLDLLIREAGKTVPDALAEAREAEDYCRYYAARCREHFTPQMLAGPTGEQNELSLHGRGVFACISPWNFPLAIFTGQVVAALAAGNSVVAKPAEPTALIASVAVQLLQAAGVPADVLHLTAARGSEFGKVAFAHSALSGVALTGSTATALTINRALAARDGALVPLIAETGGINAMIADSTALLEQLTDDVMVSAFASAGQRCSALRLLFLQEEIAEPAIEMLCGAMQELVIGNPADLNTDVGPVITAQAAAGLEQHAERMEREARILYRCRLNEDCRHGSFFAPMLVQLRDPSQLTQEIFGPILHVVRYRRSELTRTLAAIRATGYGLTMGIHSRIDRTWREIFEHSAVGNTYVNRNMIGAVVGVQPFGGQGLSGTGPKAGGPHYLQRFASERTLTVNTAAVGGNTALLSQA